MTLAGKMDAEVARVMAEDEAPTANGAVEVA